VFAAGRTRLKGQGIDAVAETVTLSSRLRVDMETETSVNTPAANALARGVHREPYSVPDLS